MLWQQKQARTIYVLEIWMCCVCVWMTSLVFDLFATFILNTFQTENTQTFAPVLHSNLMRNHFEWIVWCIFSVCAMATDRNLQLRNRIRGQIRHTGMRTSQTHETHEGSFIFKHSTCSSVFRTDVFRQFGTETECKTNCTEQNLLLVYPVSVYPIATYIHAILRSWRFGID